MLSVHSGCFSSAVPVRFSKPGALFALLLSAGLVQAAPPAGYYLVWSDEFNGGSYDQANWKSDWQARRDAIDTLRAVSCNGSNLVITTFTENGTHFTDILDTQDHFTCKYGYLESSVNFDDSPGMWSAYWMESPTMGSYIGDPGYAGIEIDICEHRKVDYNNANIDGVGQANLHWDGYGSAHKSAGSGNYGSNLGTGFHVYALRWTETNYTIYVDGVQRWTTNIAVSHRSEYVLLSSEVQSNSWAGTVPPAGYGALAASTTKLQVDYVRYYAPITTLFWGGAASDAWGDPGNWIDSRAPATNEDIVFSLQSAGNRVTRLDRDYHIRSLTLLESPGSVTIQSNTLWIGGGGIDLGSARYNLLLRSDAGLDALQSWTVSTNHSVQVYGVVSGNGGLTVRGYGQVMLYSANSYSGSTIVGSGVLRVANTNGSATGSGSVSVVAGGTLTGAGTIAGTVTVSGAIAPGDGVGTLTTGSQFWNAGGSLVWQIANATNSAGWDQLVINGQLDARAGPFHLKMCSLTAGGGPGALTGFNANSNYTWTVVTASGGIVNFDWTRFDFDTTAFWNDLAGGSFTLEQSGNSLLLRFHPNVTALRLQAAAGAGAGAVQLSSAVCPGKSYVLQSATNLGASTVWSPVATNRADLQGVWQYQDAASKTKMFYRLQAQ